MNFGNGICQVFDCRPCASVDSKKCKSPQMAMMPEMTLQGARQIDKFTPKRFNSMDASRQCLPLLRIHKCNELCNSCLCQFEDRHWKPESQRLHECEVLVSLSQHLIFLLGVSETFDALVHHFLHSCNSHIIRAAWLRNLPIHVRNKLVNFLCQRYAKLRKQQEFTVVWRKQITWRSSSITLPIDFKGILVE